MSTAIELDREKQSQIDPAIDKKVIKKRYLTKTRFKLATECPTKLFYTGKSEYANTMLDDPFLAALADGGHQVGELAKCYYPGGIEVSSLNYEEAERKTLELLKLDDVIIFEPAIRFNNLFIRIDILVKKGNHFDLIEVKAKSYSQEKDQGFLNTKGNVDSRWKPYLFDVAFQKHVLKNAFPESTVSSYLMLADKDATCTTDGLNQKFVLSRDINNRKGVRISNSLTEDDLSSKILTKVNVDDVIQLIYDTELTKGMPGNSFERNIELLSEYYERDEKIAPVIGNKCKKCEFKCSSEEESNDKQSGFKSCWKEQLGWKDTDFEEGSVLDIWNFRGSDNCITQGVVKLADVEQEHIKFTESAECALSQKERQWMQIEKVKNNDSSIYFDVDSMRNEMAGWTYPLHFIDFETSAVAIPFYKGMRPYEGIAFQFSHHIAHENGRIEHAGQFLNSHSGEFPNFEFIRELKKQLDQDEGTIFRYSNHENTYLNMIYQQLTKSQESDREILCEFIKTITRSTRESEESWHGERCMVDLWDLVKKYYYDPATKGSNSIKHVLPAILNSSHFLQNKYCKPVYGSASMSSLNFTDQAWIQFDDQRKVMDPYQLLPKMFADASVHDIKQLELLSEAEDLNNGGLAMTAYTKLQITEMSDYERNELQKALLKYCELDTFAMVVIYEAWRELQK